jgi:hypothetical protein
MSPPVFRGNIAELYTPISFAIRQLTMIVTVVNELCQKYRQTHLCFSMIEFFFFSFLPYGGLNSGPHAF